MNVIFISPHFPLYFYEFCARLKEREVHVLGIGDTSYNSLPEHTKNALTEYYRVDHLDDYEEMYRACAYFTWNYGHIDWIESQNEYWLELEAMLRSDFNVNTGMKIQDMDTIKYKSKMKDVYRKIGIPTARYHLVKDYNDTKWFANEVGYPVIVKPDKGVGASSTYELKNDDELNYFFATKDPHIPFIMEEKVPGHVETFDGISDSHKNILLCSSHVMLNPILENVTQARDTAFITQAVDQTDLYEIGKKAVDGFDAKSRFFHFEFFRLDEDREGLGHRGDIVGLEVNMRAPGAYMPDMMNYEYNVDVYTIWADMLKYDQCFYDIHRECLVGYIARRYAIDYRYSLDQVREMYAGRIIDEIEVPSIHAQAMGDYVLLVKGQTKEELYDMVQTILLRADGSQWIKEEKR